MRKLENFLFSNICNGSKFLCIYYSNKFSILMIIMWKLFNLCIFQYSSFYKKKYLLLRLLKQYFFFVCNINNYLSYNYNNIIIQQCQYWIIITIIIFHIILEQHCQVWSDECTNKSSVNIHNKYSLIKSLLIDNW